MKRLMLVMALALQALLLVGCNSTPSNVFTYILNEEYDEFIIMGTSADYAPYEWPMAVNGKQTIVGIDVEIAKLIANSLGKNLKIMNKGFDFLLDDLENGKVDFVMAGMNPTLERMEVVDFSQIYYEAIQCVLIAEENVSLYTSIDSLNIPTVKIGAQLGSVQQDLVEETFSLSQKQFVQTVPDLVLQLAEGQLNALVVEKPVADGYLANIDGLAIASITIGDPDGGSAVAVQKGNMDLLNSINALLDIIMADGTIDTIVKNAIEMNVSAE